MRNDSAIPPDMARPISAAATLDEADATGAALAVGVPTAELPDDGCCRISLRNDAKMERLTALAVGSAGKY
jgi:hypothetical protein